MKIKSLLSKNNKPKIFNLKIINNQNGDILKFFKKNDLEIGELYFSWINKNVIKGWKRHKKFNLNIVVPYGMVKFICFNNPNKKIFKFEIGEKNYKRLFIPHGYWFAFMSTNNSKSLVCSLSSKIHDKKEVETQPLNLYKFN